MHDTFCVSALTVHWVEETLNSLQGRMDDPWSFFSHQLQTADGILLGLVWKAYPEIMKWNINLVCLISHLFEFAHGILQDISNKICRQLKTILAENKEDFPLAYLMNIDATSARNTGRLLHNRAKKCWGKTHVHFVECNPISNLQEGSYVVIGVKSLQV